MLKVRYHWHLCQKFSRGLSLVELMVALAISLMVLTGVMSFFASSLKSNRFATQSSRLNQELNGAMEVMVRDIRRAGYWGKAHTGVADPTAYAANQFTSNLQADDGGIDTSTSACILFKYDRDNDDGVLESSSRERIGFKLSNGTVSMLTALPSTLTPADAHTCTMGTWESITDSRLSTVTGLTFAKTHTAMNLSVGVVCTREVIITLTGQLVSDSSITRTLAQPVRVRADWYKASGTCPTP